MGLVHIAAQLRVCDQIYERALGGMTDELARRPMDRGNRFAVMFDSEAEVPPEWFDPRSGELGFLDDEAGRVARAEFEEKGQNQRTHWDMLLERRSREELEELLEERLQVLRARRGNSK